MVYAQPNISPGEWHTQTPLGFWYTTDHLILARRPDFIIINKQQQKKERTCCIVNFAVLADHKVKLKESEKKNKYLDLIR